MKNVLNIEYIKNYMAENKLSKTKFAKLCRIGAGTLDKILGGNKKFRVVALIKIAEAMDIEFYEFFK